ncbi:MAG: 4Fe-4S dicluster domain-containing protein [Deltaproteobacteria bacterium]|nr:4Fe-4S dicluster domain-containing protein [Deltaproteobacteria bacterium]
MDGRRRFLQLAGASLVGAGIGVPVLGALGRARASGPASDAGRAGRRAMVVDPTKCLGQGVCNACQMACHRAHNVPRIDNPRHEIKWIWKEPYESAFPDEIHAYTEDALREQPVVVLCNHCASPPCVRVCPTRATFKRESDGLVMMDMHRCVGCRYCMAACPYGARSFNFVDPSPHVQGMHDGFPTRMKGVVEKCNFCAERLAKGMEPACVEACRAQGAGALSFGDPDAPGSAVAKLLRSRHALRRKPSLGTDPNVFYLV